MMRCTNTKQTWWRLALLIVLAFVLFHLLTQRLPEQNIAITEDTPLESIAEQFFRNLVNGNERGVLQHFEMIEAIRSWVQEGGSRSAFRAFRRNIGELSKTEIIQHDPQALSVELFFSGRSRIDPFKIRVSFIENQIAGIFILPWADEQAHGGVSIQLETPTGTIYGTLLEPEQATEPVPVALILAGSGPMDRNGNNPSGLHTDSYRMLAEALQQNGIASVRFDKRGVGASAAAGMDESELRFEHYVEDAVRWLELLSQEDKFSKIIVLGHSEGSLIGMLACIQSEKADAFISIAGAGRSVGELLRGQMSRQPQSIRDAFFPILDEWEQGNTVENVPSELRSLARLSVQPYWISCLKYDPRLEIKKLTIPILIVQGTTDFQVSVTDAENLSAANPDAKKVIIRDMDHTLKTNTTQQQTYTNPKYPLHKDLVPSIMQFIVGIK